MTTLTLSQQADEFRVLKATYDERRAFADELKRQVDQAQIELFERMDSEAVGAIKVGDTNFVRAETTYGQIQDRAAFVAWAQENSPELLEITERKKLVNELIRERLDNGEELPDGAGFYIKQYISQRAG